MDLISIFRICFYVCLAFTILFFIISIVLFFLFDIKTIFIKKIWSYYLHLHRLMLKYHCTYKNRERVFLPQRKGDRLGI